MSTVLAPTSPGELIDKITILQIKCERFTHATKLTNVQHELNILVDVRDRFIPSSIALSKLSVELKQTNELLWDVEDNIRLCENTADFGPRFVDLARSVYRHNDLRCALKRQINQLLGSSLTEEKSYRGESSNNHLNPRDINTPG